MSQDLRDVWIVVPAFNEATAIRAVVENVRSLFPNVVVVDDGSSDETSIEAAASGATVLTHPINLGQGAALQTGINFALRRGAEFVATFDADGQHQIHDVLAMLQCLQREGLDVVLGSRFKGRVIGLTYGRRLLLHAAVLFTNLTTGLSLTDAHNGLRVFTRKAIQTIHLYQNRMAHASEILEQIARNGLKYAEVGNTIRYTEYSRAKGQRASNAINIVIDLFIGRLR